MVYDPQESMNKLKELIDFCEEYQYDIVRWNLEENITLVKVNECCNTVYLIYEDNKWQPIFVTSINSLKQLFYNLNLSI